MKKNRGLAALLAISMLTGSITIDPQEVYAAENQNIVEIQDDVLEREAPLQNEEQKDQEPVEAEENIEEEPEKVIEEADEIEEELQLDEQTEKEPENDPEETETLEKASASQSFVSDEEATLANVILFVDFSKNEKSHSFDKIEKIFDGSDEYKKALKPYIEGISYGKERIQNVFPQYDSENDAIVPYVLSEDELYYADHQEELVADAENALYDEGWTADQLDFNKDGRIDNLMIVVAGEGNWSDADLVSGTDGYSIISEQAIEDEQAGTIAHAFLLGQGYPELRDENTNNSWDIMEYIGSETPAPLVWLRQSISGWTSLKTITDSQAHVTLYADKADEQAVILKKPDSDTDFLVAEYREKKNSQENGYDNEISESGLIIYKVSTAEDNAETAIIWSDGSDSGITIENVQNEENGAITFDVNYIRPKEGLQYDSETGSWYLYKQGKVDTTYTGLAQNENGWWYVKDGKLDWNFTGLTYYYGTWYYVQKGALNWNYNGFVQHVDKKWYYVQGGKIRFDFTGLAKHIDNKWYYAEKGIINWKYTGLAKNTYGYWYYVRNGQYYTGYSGLVYYNGSWFCVRSGYLDWGYTSVVKYKNDWFYVENGKVNWGYTGPAMNENGWWYIRNGKLDWNYSGKGTYKGVPYTVSKGYVTFSTGNQFYLNNCIASGYNGSQMTITLSASRNAVLEQLGGQFCIIMMSSAGTQVLETLPANSSSGGSFTVSAVLKSNDSFKKAAMAQYAIGWKNGNRYQKISGIRMLGNPEITATMTKTYLGYYDTYKISSKKGMQGTSEGYTEDMAVQHALLNVDIANMVSTTKKTGYVPYSYKGKTYYFQDMIALCRTIRYLNGWDNENPYGNHTRSVTLVLLMSWKDEVSYLIHPSARKKGAASYYALNMKDQAARDTLEALFCYMGEKLGDNKARVSNWTLGNEVNSCKAWNYSGNMSLQECVENYAQAFQLLYQGVKRTASTSRVFISLDHCWNRADAGHTGKEYLDAFAAYMAKTAPSMQWNVNYHPYSQPLNNNRFWGDGSHTVSNTGTGYISMKNIQVLTDYLGTLENKYHKQSGSIRVILGEMGYTARQGNSKEETEQAAALGYGYYIAMFNTRIDAYIIRAYIDDPAESRAGLYLGMFSSDYKKKQAYDVYKHLDKQDSLNYMNRYLSVIGISSWKSAIPGFDASKLPADDF